MSLYSKMKDYITIKYPDVISEYSEWIIANGNDSFKRKLHAYIHLLGLIVCRKAKIVKIKYGEYEDCKREDISRLIEKITDYDVISFDIFDTLILRNVERPEDVFDVVGAKLNISGFGFARKRVEKSLWDKGNYTIDDIYVALECQRGISLQCKEFEFQTELAVCTVNPYMKQLYDAAIEQGKIVVATSDMYWPKSYIEQILNKCGYTGLKNIFVSCDYGVDKKSGKLYKVLKEKEFAGRKILHIGDNYNADVYHAKKAGIDAMQYIPVYEYGKKYRKNGYEKRALGMSVADAIINNKIHNGICELEQYEQYGYIYGGPLIAGYCQYIEDVSEEKKIDKLLFVARDADVICKAYKKYFGKIDCEYVYASRNAVAQLAFERYPDFFIEQVLQLRFIDKKEKTTIKEVLEQSGLQCLSEKLSEVGLTEDAFLEHTEMELLSELIYRYKQEIIDAFADVRQGAYLYWKEAIGTAHKIALVDIGWQGSTMVCLDYFLNEVCKLSVDLWTIQLGTIRTKWNGKYLDEKCIFSYCFSDEYNQEIGRTMMYQPIRKNIIEIMFTAPHATLVSYKVDENGAGVPVFAELIKDNIDVNQKIQKGILLFVEQFAAIEEKIGHNLYISGEKAFQRLCDISNQRKYIYYLFKDYMFSNVPCDAKQEKMGAVIKRI